MDSPLSHHDPDNQDKSNRNLFRRMKKVIEIGSDSKTISQERINTIVGVFPVPVDISDLFGELAISQFFATVMFYEFIIRYGGGDGLGLFEGQERYRRLEERFQQSAVQASSLFDLWGITCNSLQVPNVDHGRDENFLRLLSIPASLAGDVLKVISTEPRAIVMLARTWVEFEKRRDPTYAAKAKSPVSSPELVRLSFIAPSEQQKRQTVIELPTFSANSLRHELIREPGMWHLFSSLGIAFDEPSPVVTAMFYNGGDIKSGASAPDNVFHLRKMICQKYPLLGLISGGTDSFILGESNLRVHSWVICRENNDVLSRHGLSSNMSLFETIDDWTLTRHANRVNSGQMPFGFEALAANTEIAVRLAVTPYANDLEVGALMAAIDSFQRCDSTIGGQPARGFGLSTLDWHDCMPATHLMDSYNQYLSENAETLRDGIVDDTLATGKKVVTM